MLVAAYMEKHPGSPQTIKQHLAAIKMLFDYLVISQREPDSPLFPAAIGKTGKLSRRHASFCNFIGPLDQKRASPLDGVAGTHTN